MTKNELVDMSIIISDLYQRLDEVGYNNIIEYFKHKDINYDDVLICLNYIESRLKKIEKQEEDINYNRQIMTSFSIIPKRIETILYEELITEAQNTSIEDISDYIEQYKETTNELLITGLKYQFRYLKVTLSQILTDDEIWNDLVY